MKKNVAFVCFMMVMMLSFSSVASLAQEQEKNVPDIARLYVEYLLTSNVAGLDKILADSYIYVAPNGYMLDKKAFVNLFKQRIVHIKHMTIADPIVMTHGNVHILTCDILYQGTLHMAKPVELQRVTIVVQDGASSADDDTILLYQATPVQQNATLDEEEAKLIESLRDGTWKSQ